MDLKKESGGKKISRQLNEGMKIFKIWKMIPYTQSARYYFNIFTLKEDHNA